MHSEFDDPFEQDSGGTVFRDVVLLALIGFVAMIIMILPHINPPKTENTAGMPITPQPTCRTS